MWSKLTSAAVPAAALTLALALAACGGSADAGDSSAAATPQANVAGVVAGDTVAALWTDGNYYLATVDEVADGTVTVTYVDDGSSGTVEVAGVRAIPDQPFAVGDRVLAVWSAGRFYPGEITALDGEAYVVTWDDGSTPSTVEGASIIAE